MYIVDLYTKKCPHKVYNMLYLVKTLNTQLIFKFKYINLEKPI